MTVNCLLAIDVGNTRLKLGVFEIGTLATGLPVPRFTSAQRLVDLPDWHELRDYCAREQVQLTAAVVAGPHPDAIERLCRNWSASISTPPRTISRSADLPIQTAVDRPDQVGIDRLLNAVAANRKRPERKPAVVVSAGTATTVDLISAEGVFCGGTISPGLELGARALHQYTALLPLVDVVQLAQDSTVPVIGTNTVNAIRSGLWHGHVGAVREIARQLEKACGTPAVRFITGGNGSALARELKDGFVLEENLALRGLAVAAGGCVEKRREPDESN